MTPVTAHAVLRYLIRVEKVDLGPVVRAVGRKAGNTRLAHAAAERAGWNYDRLVEHIAPDHVSASIAAGARRIRLATHVLIIEAGVIVSVIDKRQRPHRKTVMSEAELRRHRGRVRRRTKS